MNNERIGAIDGLRGLAALAVALFHCQPLFFSTSVPQWGDMPTQLFFVLSGYILTMKYEEGLHSGAVSAWAFIVLRISRLWPLHVFALLLVVASEWLFWNHYGRFHTFGKNETATAFVLNLLMVQNWGFHSAPAFNIPAWSISSELAVNLMWMAALIYRRWTIASAVAVVAVTMLLMLSASPTLHLNLFETVFGVTWGILRTALGFSLGCLLCWYTRRNGVVVHQLLSGTIQVVLIVCLTLYVAFRTPGIDWLLALVLLPAITLVALDPNSVTARIMDTPIMRWLGDISYSVYLLHLPLWTLMSLLLVWGIGFPPTPYLGLLWLGIVLAASTASLHCIEKPGMLWMRRLASRRSAAALAPHGAAQNGILL